MKYIANKIFSKSIILKYFSNFNKYLLTAFHGSFAYKFFLRSNFFLKNVLMESYKNSKAVRTVRNIILGVRVRDIGVFIVFTVIFNTAVMIFINRKIGMLSALARLLFLILGIIFVLQDKVSSNNKNAKNKNS